MEKYKYIHIFYTPETKFSMRTVEMIYKNTEHFHYKEHLFVTPYKEVYDVLAFYENVEYVETSGRKDVRIIAKYADLCDWLILHSAPSIISSLLIKNKHCKKIVWRTWGHDVSYTYQKGEILKNCVKHIGEFVWKHKVAQFRAIGIANTVDSIDIRKHFGDKECFPIPYVETGIDEVFKMVNESLKDKHDGCNILLGHSGYQNDNHIEMLKRLSKYKDKDICIYLILSYGDRCYIDTVKRYVESEWNEKIKLITTFMEYEEYISFLSKMDIGILDAKASYALGNVSWLLYAQKKLFLNKDGVLREAFEENAIPYMYTEQIGEISFEEFISPLHYGTEKSDMLPRSYNDGIKAWLTVLNELNGN